MVKSKKESATKVEAAPVSTTKPSKKCKRDAEVDLDIQKNPKKQKKELIQAEKKVPPKKVESSSSILLILRKNSRLRNLLRNLYLRRMSHLHLPKMNLRMRSLSR